jgi:DNA-binding MarR family transcriptional regulator
VKTGPFYILLATEARILVSILTQESQRALDRRLSAYNPRVSRLQYSILCALTEDGKTIADLSGYLARNPSTFVPAVDALERKGLLRRGQDPEDRRRIPLALTDSGRKLLADVPFVDASDPLVHGLRAMGEEQVGRLRTLLNELLRDMPCGQELLQKVEREVSMRAHCPERRDHR